MNRLIIGSPDKTNFILPFVAEDLPSGFLLLDPTGDLGRASANIIPIKDTQRAFYFDPSDLAHPAGFNVLEDVHRDHHAKLTEDLCAYFEGMWPNGWGAQSNYILANCLRVLLVTPGSTLLGILKLLTDKGYRAQCLQNCADPVVLANWGVINAWDKRQEQTALAPLLNKIGTLLMSPTIRNIAGQTKSTFSLVNDRIVIADLNRAKLGDLTARLLGGLLIARSSGRVYINELGFFPSDYVASLLPQDRFIVVLNFLAETRRSSALAQALLSIEDKTILRTNRKDAEELSFYVNAPNPRKLVDLPSDQALTAAGAFTPKPIPSLKRLRALRKRSRARHCRPRAIIEARISRYFAM